MDIEANMDDTKKDLLFNFGQAMENMLRGVRMSAKFLPDNIFIEVQKPDAGSMNTEPYLKMVTVAPGEAGADWAILRCEPWEPGRRSLFSEEWYVSKY